MAHACVRNAAMLGSKRTVATNARVSSVTDAPRAKADGHNQLAGSVVDSAHCFANGSNTCYIESLFAKWAKDPFSVPLTWHSCFKDVIGDERYPSVDHAAVIIDFYKRWLNEPQSVDATWHDFFKTCLRAAAPDMPELSTCESAMVSVSSPTKCMSSALECIDDYMASVADTFMCQAPKAPQAASTPTVFCNISENTGSSSESQPKLILSTAKRLETKSLVKPTPSVSQIKASRIAVNKAQPAPKSIAIVSAHNTKKVVTPENPTFWSTYPDKESLINAMKSSARNGTIYDYFAFIAAYEETPRPCATDSNFPTNLIQSPKCTSSALQPLYKNDLSRNDASLDSPCKDADMHKTKQKRNFGVWRQTGFDGF